MFALPAAAIVPLVLINVLFATLALAIGFAAGWWVFHPKGEVETASTTQTERALMAASRLQDLAHSVAHDVGAHSDQVEQITHELNELRESGADPLDEAVLVRMARMQEANDKLQTQLASAEEKIEKQAEQLATQETAAKTDSLTGLNNRRAFDAEMNRRFAEWQRMEAPFSLMIFDVDHFKKFNDTYGHQAGDSVLQNVGRVLTEIVRETDVPCRYGGEEFAVVMPSTTTEEAKRVVERARKTIEGMTLHFDGKQLKVTASVGLAEILPEDDTANLIRRADEALYACKEAGRNCGHYHDGETSIPITPGVKTKSEPKKPTSLPEIEILDRLPPRGRFDEEVSRRVAESGRYGVPLSVLFVDVTNHKAVAASKGQPVANVMLDQIAQYLQGTIRDMDLLARDVQGVFAIMLPDSSAAESRQIASRIDTALANRVIVAGKESVRPKVQLGFSEYVDGDDVDSLVLRAQHSIGRDLDLSPEEALNA